MQLAANNYTQYLAAAVKTEVRHVTVPVYVGVQQQIPVFHVPVRVSHRKQYSGVRSQASLQVDISHLVLDI